MITNTLKGDLITMIKNSIGKENNFIMVQGCNCHITQGSGIAGQLREFPEVYEADIEFGRKGDKSKLGEYSIGVIDGKVTVINMYTQFDFGTEKRQVSYDAIALGFERLNKSMVMWDIEDTIVYIPMIGAGLAGGDWDAIKAIINSVTPDIEIHVVDFKQGVDPRTEWVDSMKDSLKTKGFI